MDIGAFNKQMRTYLRKINLKTVQQMNRCIRPLGITPSQMMILFSLDRQGTMNISELEEHAELPKSNVSAICGRLEESGLVTRHRDSNDQRIVYVTLTDDARVLIKRAKQVVDTEQNRLAGRLSDEQREQILQGLSLLYQMFREETGGKKT